MWEAWNKIIGGTVYAVQVATVGNRYAKIIKVAVVPVY